MVASITGVVALTGILPTSAQSAPGATRSFDSTSVAPGGQVVVTIAAANYGSAGGVTETLPTGFVYVSSGLSASQINESGQNVRFILQGDTSFTYTVRASSTPGSYDFSGTLRDFERDDHTVGGVDTVTVEGLQHTDIRWGPGGGDHRRRQLRVGGRGHRDAAHRVRLRVPMTSPVR